MISIEPQVRSICDNVRPDRQGTSLLFSWVIVYMVKTSLLHL